MVDLTREPTGAECSAIYKMGLQDAREGGAFNYGEDTFKTDYAKEVYDACRLLCTRLHSGFAKKVIKIEVKRQSAVRSLQNTERLLQAPARKALPGGNAEKGFHEDYREQRHHSEATSSARSAARSAETDATDAWAEAAEALVDAEFAREEAKYRAESWLAPYRKGIAKIDPTLAEKLRPYTDAGLFGGGDDDPLVKVTQRYPILFGPISGALALEPPAPEDSALDTGVKSLGASKNHANDAKEQSHVH